MKLKLSKWSDISINDYREIVRIIEDPDTSADEKDLSLIALLCGVEEETVWSLKISELAGLRSQLRFLDDFNFPKSKIDSITIGGEKYRITYDIADFTMSQYVDFQAYYNKEGWIGNLEKCLSVFIVPKGRKYGEGYDVAALQETMANEMPITTAQQVFFSFLMSLQRSTDSIRTYLG